MGIISQLAENDMHLRNYMKLIKEDEFQCVCSVKDATHIEVEKFDKNFGYYWPKLFPIIDGKIVYTVYHILPYRIVNPNYCSMLRFMNLGRLRG